MAKLNAPHLNDLKLYHENPLLSDPSIGPDRIGLILDHEEKISLKDGKTEVGSVTISAQAESAFAIVNDTKDPDHGGFFNLGEEEEPSITDPLQMPAVVPFDRNSAYIVLLAINASGKIAGKGPLGGVSADTAAAGTVELTLCRRFRRDERLQSALGTVLKEHKTVFSHGDLSALTKDETLGICPGAEKGVKLCTLHL